MEKLKPANVDIQTDQKERLAEKAPSFDPAAAARRIKVIGDALSDDGEPEYVWGNSNEESNAYEEPESARDLEKSKARIPKFEKILSSPNLLKEARKNYLEQYQPKSEARADILSCKDLLDHYVVGQLSGENANSFTNSDQFKNYASYIMETARQKSITINGAKFYPELATNPVLNNPNFRKLVVKAEKPEDEAGKMLGMLAKNEAGYRGYLKIIGERLENRSKVSQGELDIVGDYLYAGRDFDSGLAKQFACYLFNGTKQRNDLHSSTQIGGALANYFAHEDTLDDRLKDRRIIVANNSGWDDRVKQPKPVRTGVSTRDYCALEQNKVNALSLSSTEGLNKSRPETIADLYSLMMVSFHELTHDYQKMMMTDGKDNTGAMASILNSILRTNPSECFQVVDKNLHAVLDENGNEVKSDYYRANHDSDEMEIQADEEAWRQCRQFIHKHEVRYSWDKKDKDTSERASKHWSQCLDNAQEVRARRAFALKVDENGQEMSYIQYDIEQLSRSIKGNPGLLKEYPQLSKFFDKVGSIKPDIFFDKEIANIDYGAIDAMTDDFGVEIATYALMSSTDVNNILSYIQNPNNDLSEKQIKRCLNNLWNVLHQDALKTRPLKNINFDNYSETKTRGKYTSKGGLQESYLKQYLHQLFNCTHIAEVLREKYPQAGDIIDHNEQVYFISYYDELAKGVNLPPDYSKAVKNSFLRTKNTSLQQIAIQL